MLGEIWPLIAVVIGVLILLMLIMWFKLNTFIALIITSMLTGVLGSLYNSHGVPVVIYSTLTGLSVKTLSSTIQAHFLLTAIFEGTGDIWTSATLPLFFLACPFLLISVLIGKYCKRHTLDYHFDKWLYLFIAFLGLLLIFAH
ncbi:hypothetical protein QI204_02840 [Staphylococcus saprophyticus]|nr:MULTISPECIES: hypothetical protein [Staphylococcus]MDT3978582.1 hypothetical protein [Staphylococcus saprophyticus]MDT3997569.1 hypothetical protein [Staphylococcus saprophyticus]MDW4214996.1 hypothetical protein [Staphylococcus saprophyticus]MDW4233172.1 hypothetical protein [Staphylococcus saprophyticus]MDW4250954.1 hypothetical protein [Staphylococcus saprophyticus]